MTTDGKVVEHSMVMVNLVRTQLMAKTVGSAIPDIVMLSRDFG